MADTDNSFLGKGMKFPPQINPATGRFVTASAEESVKQSIYLILMTQVTERPLRPEFGSNIMSYTFMDKNAGRLNMVSRPRVSDVSVDIDMGERSGVLIFNIDYTIAATNTRDNLVFPFYLNVTDEEEEEGEPEIYEPETVEEFGN